VLTPHLSTWTRHASRIYQYLKDDDNCLILLYNKIEVWTETFTGYLYYDIIVACVRQSIMHKDSNVVNMLQDNVFSSLLYNDYWLSIFRVDMTDNAQRSEGY
jgi:hypothetical protein